jgi:hypothetical protein
MSSWTTPWRHGIASVSTTSKEDLRPNGNVNDVADVPMAVFERNGHISVVRRP